MWPPGGMAVLARMSGWKFRLWMTLAVALVLRLGLALEVQLRVSQTPGRLCLIDGDAEGYWVLAGKIADGDEYSIFNPPRRLLRMPGFPLLLAIPRLIFGNFPPAARILLALVGTLACGLTYWLGSELADEAVGFYAALYTALSPTMLIFSVLFLSETAFAAALLASFIAAAKLLRCGRHALLTGCLIGVATYMRPTWLLVGPGIAIVTLLFGNGSLRSRAVAAILVGFGLCLVMAPWTIRNAVVTGHAIPTTLWVGPSLYDGLNPTFTGDSNMEFFEQDQLLEKMSEYDMDREYRRRAWDFAARNPGQVVSLAVTKQLRYWSPAPNSPQFDHPAIFVIAWLAYIPLIGFSALGAWSVRHNLRLLILTAAPVFYFAALHLLFVGSLRYRLPAEYPLAILAAVGLTGFGRRCAVVRE